MAQSFKDSGGTVGVGRKQCPLGLHALLGHSAHELVSAGGFHRHQEITVPDPNLYQ